MPTINGISCDPILSPEQRIEMFLNCLKNKIDKAQLPTDGKPCAELILKLAQIWFKDEVEIMNLYISGKLKSEND